MLHHRLSIDIIEYAGINIKPKNDCNTLNSSLSSYKKYH